MSVVLSKCDGTDCTKRGTCRRFLIEPLSRYQPYICMAVSIKNPESCRFFINNSEREIELK